MFSFLKLLSPTMWRCLSIVLLVLAFITSIWYYGDVQYKNGHLEGVTSADKTWTTKYNSTVDAYNARIKTIEDLSKTEAADLEKRVGALNTELAELKARRSASVDNAYTADGSVFTCPKPTSLKLGTATGTSLKLAVAQEQEPVLKLYLSESFSIEWDAVNTTVNADLASVVANGFK